MLRCGLGCSVGQVSHMPVKTWAGVVPGSTHSREPWPGEGNRPRDVGQVSGKQQDRFQVYPGDQVHRSGTEFSPMGCVAVAIVQAGTKSNGLWLNAKCLLNEADILTAQTFAKWCNVFLAIYSCNWHYSVLVLLVDMQFYVLILPVSEQNCFSYILNSFAVSEYNPLKIRFILA